MRLDRIDLLILEKLQRDARISNKELAAAVRIAPSTCLLRVQRLIDNRVVRGFHADVDPSALGIGIQAISFIRLGKHAQASFERLRCELLEIPEVMAVWLMAGQHDVLVQVVAKDVAQLREVLANIISPKRNVAHVETSLILEQAHKAVLPAYNESFL